MATTSTTTSVWRSGGGDSSKTTYAGSMLMVADFYFLPTATAGTAIQRSSTDIRAVVLPAGAIVVEIQANAAATGGTNPTFNMGFTTYSSGASTPTGLLSGADADLGKQVFTWATATVPGANLGLVMSATEMVTITGNVGSSAATGGSITGRLVYYVPTDGAYTV